VARFESRDDRELGELGDEALLAYYAAARESGHASAQDALGVLVFRYFDDVHRRCRIKVPPADAEDVAQEAMVSAIRSSLAGRTIGEFRAWLNRIVARRIADYHRRPAVETTALPEDHTDSEEVWGQAGVVEDETGVVEVNDAVALVLDELSDPHRRVVEVFVFDAATAEEAVAAVNGELPDLDPPMSIDNVSQIARRFRQRLRAVLEESDNPS
jgi:RNA polymerase sigma factor (sigma-70 family)